jgi:hypothetical protein
MTQRALKRKSPKVGLSKMITQAWGPATQDVSVPEFFSAKGEENFSSAMALEHSRFIAICLKLLGLVTRINA